MGKFQAAIFDLDGVIVNTVPLHFKAWKKMFSEYSRDFTFEDYKNKVDGIPRIDGARAVLNELSEEELRAACDKKQKYFLKLLETEGIEAYDSTVELMKQFKSKGIKIAVISSSKNLPMILEKINIRRLCDTCISGHDITKGKPDPQIFQMAAKRLNAPCGNSVVFEDALLGVEAAKRAGMKCVGIDRYNKPERLKKADIVVSDLSQLTYGEILRLF